MSEWSPKQKRAYHRIKSGFTVASRFGESVRFITLTSAPGVSNLHRHFRVLAKRIKRKFGKFEYFRVATNEGNGVLHVLYRGAFIPQPYLKRMWADIHDSFVVDIRAVRLYKGLGAYVVSQYLSDQHTSFVRSCWSWGWVYKGFVKVWYEIKRQYKGIFPALEAWDSHLKGFMVKLSDRGVQRFLSPCPIIYRMETQQTLVDLGVFIDGIPPSPHYERLCASCAWL